MHRHGSAFSRNLGEPRGRMETPPIRISLSILHYLAAEVNNRHTYSGSAAQHFRGYPGIQYS